MELSVIIVNYNGIKYLKECFNSLYDKLSGINFEIIVLDNNSADDSCTYITQNYPQVKLIRSKENLGFGLGNNAAVEEAMGKYLLLINNDTIVQDHLAPAMEILKNDVSIGALGIRMLDGNGKYLISAGKFPSFYNVIRIKNIFRMGPEFKTGIFGRPLYNVDWLGGSFILMPKEIYNRVGGFDKDYFMYCEDVDLCKRIADTGLHRVFASDFNYIHFVGYDKSRDKLVLKGLSLYIEKHMSGLDKIVSQMALYLNRMMKGIKKTFGL